MARLGIFIDGAYMDKLAEADFGIWVDYQKLADAIIEEIRRRSQEPVDLLRAYYYNSLPYQGDPPTEEESRRVSQKRSFFNALERLRRFQVREGWLVLRGTGQDGSRIFQQKRVDMMLGLDLASLSAGSRISHAAIVAGDSDFMPAVNYAREHGVVVSLFHGSRRSRHTSYSNELWAAADERYEINQEFMSRVERQRR